ncbi:MAG TPA: FAD-binding oxidoreductase [Steroidobacteraceae bacterium]|nr:FAD-binding oxidoreductase [Steroidobacteraceae bacterium]
MMKRRTFCTSAVAALAAASLPLRRGLASEVAAAGPGGKQVLLQSTAIDDLRASLRGELLLPGQDGYDSARRVWNGAFDRRPALIARCAGAADVIQSVKFARANHLLVAVRGGGHSLSGQSVCEGGLMIDLTPMKSVHIDPLARTARVEPGVLLGQFDREAQAFGLATTAGTVSHTGVAGLTLGGGFGRLGRRFGLACDNVRAAELVSADGTFVQTSETDNAELLWGLRGGGGNFGVVTSFEYRMHPVDPTVLAGPLVYSFADAREVLHFFADYIARAPDELYADALLVPTPDGKRTVVFDICYSGAIAEGERILAPLRKFGKPLVDGVRPMPYIAIQKSGDDNFPIGRAYYIKSGYLKQLDAKTLDAAVDQLAATRVGQSAILFAHAGGAIARVKPGSAAFQHRDATYSMVIMSFWDKPAERDPGMQWARASWKVMEPMTEGFYVNEVSNEDPERRIRANYGASYDRLVKLKNRYDPTNLFQMNANVKPTA